MPLDATAIGTIDLVLHEKQGIAMDTEATEVLYGGAAGGGKSWLMRACAVLWASAISGLQIYLFRRLRDDLIKNHMEGPKGLHQMLAPWVVAGYVQIVEDEIRFWNGSKIYLCHCKDEKDKFKYQGAEIHVLLADELTAFTETMYRFLRGRVRMVGINLPPEYAGRFPRILASSNPGNIGHHWVKAAFIDNAIPLELRAMNDNEGGMVRQYIPAKLDDNPSMANDDPNYRARLRGLGSDALVKAMEDGDWNVVAGAYFSNWSTERHVIRPFTIPPHWTRIGSFDWGSAKPFSMGWWAVSDGNPLSDGRLYPTGAMIRYREWYGASAPNVGLRMQPVEIADGIRLREQGERIELRVADPACWKVEQGPSIAETMIGRGVAFRPADNSRVSGWTQMRGRLDGEDGGPMLYAFDTCGAFIRTMPALQHDAHNAEDIDSDGEDHAADECFVAGTMIATDGGGVPIEQMRVGDYVRTRSGLRRVSAVFSVGARNVYRIGMSDGGTLTGTANHPIWVEGQGFKPLHSLRYGDMMRPCASSFSAPQFKSFAASGITCAEHTSGTPDNSCTALFGVLSTGRSLKALISTIATTTLQTISRTISFASILPSILPSTEGSERENRPSTLSTRDRVRLLGMRLRLALSGIASTMKTIAENSCTSVMPWIAHVVGCGSKASRSLVFAPTHASQGGAAINWLMTLSGSAKAADCRSSPISSRQRAIAHEHALSQEHMSGRLLSDRAKGVASAFQHDHPSRFGAPRVAGNPMPVGTEPVYNLTVEGAEEYFANGVLVHNCRYACMARPWTRMPKVQNPMRGMHDMTLTEAFKLARPRVVGGGRI